MISRAFAAVCLSVALGASCTPPDTTGMVRIEGGEFLMGTDRGMPFEGPIHRVVLDSYWMDETEVTNAQFEQFIDATGHVTTAEELGDSGVFYPGATAWDLVKGADWRHPEGPDTSIDERMDHPVYHVSWMDANAYCEWRGGRLPSEAEFEYAARGGLDDAAFAWGDDFNPKGEFRANTWQGYFPDHDEVKDGFPGVAPVKSFPANGYGLYDITGNVWEWTNDWFDPEYYRKSPTKNPRGPSSGVQRVQRGGSWLCSVNYCQGYRVASRMQTEPDSGLNNLGFRCVVD